jgi:hypothetical protein
MAEIKPGTIAYVKITDEPVYVIDIKPLSGFHVLAGVLSGVEEPCVARTSMNTDVSRTQSNTFL